MSADRMSERECVSVCGCACRYVSVSAFASGLWTEKATKLAQSKIDSQNHIIVIVSLSLCRSVLRTDFMSLRRLSYLTFVD